MYAMFSYLLLFTYIILCNTGAIVTCLLMQLDLTTAYMKLFVNMNDENGEFLNGAHFQNLRPTLLILEQYTGTHSMLL